MAYFIAVYDVNQKRCGKMLKLFRQYLRWVQNSVFEGELTLSQYKRLQQEADALREESDCVIFYQLRDEQYVDRIVLGEEQGEHERFL